MMHRTSAFRRYVRPAANQAVTQDSPMDRSHSEPASVIAAAVGADSKFQSSPARSLPRAAAKRAAEAKALLMKRSSHSNSGTS